MLLLMYLLSTLVALLIFAVLGVTAWVDKLRFWHIVTWFFCFWANLIWTIVLLWSLVTNA